MTASSTIDLDAPASDRRREAERLVKSSERVRDLGEVFTPAVTVEAMLDLLPQKLWRPHPAATFLEPAAGDGNFLVAILARKLAAVSEARKHGELPAGDDVAALEFHGLEALSSIYGMDISVDNIVGGTPGHEVGARDRMLIVFTDWFQHATETRLTARSVVLASARWIVERNLLVADMLPFKANGTRNPRAALSLVEYRWDPTKGRVEVIATTLGQVEEEARRRAGGPATLLDLMNDLTVAWSGPARDLRNVPITAPSPYTGPPRNGRR